MGQVADQVMGMDATSGGGEVEGIPGLVGVEAWCNQSVAEKQAGLCRGADGGGVTGASIQSRLNTEVPPGLSGRLFGASTG